MPKIDVVQIVWFFDKPTIGYCKECDTIATWDSGRGLHCPKCGTKELSVFTYDGDGPYPE